MKAPLGPLYCSVFECQLPKAKTDTRFTSALQRLSHSDFSVLQLAHPQAFNRHLAGSAEPFRVARPEAVGLGRTKAVLERLMDVLLFKGCSRRESRIVGATWLVDPMIPRQQLYNIGFKMLSSSTFMMRSDRNRI